MPSQDPVLSTVQRTLLRGKKVPDALSALGSTCSAGAQCTQVQTSPVATAALGDLKVKVDTANTSLVTKKKADQDARTAGKTLRNDVKSVRVSLGTYETAVAGVSGGDAAIITKAGLPSRPVAPTAKPPMQMVTKLTAAVGKTAKTAKLRWPVAPGAASYAIQVNWTPQSPGGPWINLGTCTRRSKVVTAPTPGAQFLVQVASVTSDGTPAEWCDAILATAR